MSLEMMIQVLREALADILEVSNEDEVRHIAEDALEETSGVERS